MAHSLIPTSPRVREQLFSSCRHFATATGSGLTLLRDTQIFAMPSWLPVSNLFRSDPMWPEVSPPLCSCHSPITSLSCCSNSLQQPSSPRLKAFRQSKPHHFKSFKVSAQDTNRIRPISCQSQSNPCLKADFMCVDRVLGHKGPESLLNKLPSLLGIPSRACQLLSPQPPWILSPQSLGSAQRLILP